MSRFYLIALFCLFLGNGFFSQSNLGNYLKAAEDKYTNGDYYYSVELYEKAMAIDSNSVEILWKYAEALRAFKDYRKAEFYYAKVYDRESAALYPMSLIQLGLMQKHNGKYAEALETFKLAKKKFSKDKKGYNYLKSKREMESCLWAKTAVNDTCDVVFSRLPETVNSPDTEFGHTVQDGKLLFSSLRADSINLSEEVYTKNYKTRLYQSPILEGKPAASERIESLFIEKFSTGNGSFSNDGKKFYFSLCSDEGYNYTCKIMVASYENGRWSAIDSLGKIINESGANTTMPNVGKLNGQEVLYFSSNRLGTEGGMDLWYSVIKNGNQFSKAQNIKALNSPDNELSPWWDSTKNELYFSSSWHDGFGGYDVFRSNFSTQFEKPENIGLPFNSAANDLYYFKSGDTSYFSSNRLGVLFSKNPTCCSDIFSAIPPIVLQEATPKETLAELNKRLPVTLYFHNDCPDPKSKDTLTNVNYLEGYSEYRAMLDKYQSEYSSGLNGAKAEEAKEDIESFFMEYVDQGVKDLAVFQDLLLEELKKGAKINITVKGFASPLAKTDYNVNLTKRRISSLENYLMHTENGAFRPYLRNNATNGGSVTISQVPFGEYTANKLTSDNFHDQKNSVYSRAAAIERKIEIQSVTYLDRDSLFFITEVTPRYIDLAKIPNTKQFSKSIQLKNNSNTVLEIERIETPKESVKVKFTSEIPAGKSITIGLEFTGNLPKGLFSFPVQIYFKNYTEPITIMVNGEGQ